MTDDDPTSTGGKVANHGSVKDASVKRLESMNNNGDGNTFNAPWQARAFALAVSLSEDHTYDWEEFQERLVEEIGRDEADGADLESTYYRNWLAALERLLIEDDVLEVGELTQRTEEFAAGERDASEWVEDGHSHNHPHNHG
jgi:nitrile hydratase accessory protein